jgi:hypothetical protein
VSEDTSYPLSVRLGLSIYDLASQRAQLLFTLEQLHARLSGGVTGDDDVPTDLRWILDACKTEVSRSVMDLELQADAQHLLDEAREAADEAEEVLGVRWIVSKPPGEPEGPDEIRCVANGAYVRALEAEGLAAILERTERCASVAFRFVCLGFLIPDGTGFWPGDMQDRNRRYVKGPVFGTIATGYGLEPPSSQVS